ncbi:putative mitochondrial protein, conserved [Thelotrema lepadinum]|nr:putative mitochondrial protein, conserved [Thelotrema lepadinum]
MIPSARVSVSRAIAAKRFFSVASSQRRAPFGAPSPPRLPEQEQKVFEELQKSSTGAFSTPRPQIHVNQSPASFTSKSQINQSPATTETSSQSGGIDTSPTVNAQVRAEGDGEELHPNVRRGAAPEFDGDTNPKTGEVGGPKNDPLRWGGNVDWSYNGRVTDF